MQTFFYEAAEPGVTGIQAPIIQHRKISHMISAVTAIPSRQRWAPVAWGRGRLDQEIRE